MLGQCADGVHRVDIVATAWSVSSVINRFLLLCSCGNLSVRIWESAWAQWNSLSTEWKLDGRCGVEGKRSNEMFDFLKLSSSAYIWIIYS